MTSIHRIFDAANYTAVSLPADQASCLPAWCYTSEDFYRTEVSNIFLKSWCFFGRADRIPNAGDYFAVSLVGVQVIVVRDKDGQLHALSNSCRHRGTQIAIGEGNCRAFQCPYHGWTYDLQGNLRGAPGMGGAKDFDVSQHGLRRFRVETWGGFVFVNFEDSAASLETYLGDLPEQMAAYDCDNFVLTRRVEFEVDCNWKSHIENSVEDYHVPYVHSSTLDEIDSGYEHFEPETRGNWLVMREKHEGTRALLSQDTEHAFPRIETLVGHAAEGTNFVCLFPSTLLAFTVDSMWYIELYPQGPLKTKLAIGMCFPRKTTEREDFEEKAAYYYKRWVTAVGEDNRIVEAQLRGLRSPFARTGRLSPLEPLIAQMGQWWIDRVIPAAT